METSPTPRSSLEDCQHYPELIRRTTVQDGAWRKADRCIPIKDRSQTRLSTLHLHYSFLLVDWIMKTSTSEGKHGMQWTAQNRLDDLDFSNDLAFASHTHEQMQMKTTDVAAVSASVGLSIHQGPQIQHGEQQSNHS
ncbi:unnamed protein product [Schistosoma mattheei]|uniref:Uncharacterized protein n=1 Tax=Schistosoma mattheei TaxID=31246 RepID=A0A183Q616_9TREM|nr:unnamed protein product [Schistosoma mattheei]